MSSSSPETRRKSATVVARTKQNRKNGKKSEEIKVGKKSILNNKEIAKLTKIPPPSTMISAGNDEEPEEREDARE